MSRPLRRTEEEIAPPPVLQRKLATDIAKILVSNPAMCSSWQYERIVELIARYTDTVTETP